MGRGKSSPSLASLATRRGTHQSRQTHKRSSGPTRASHELPSDNRATDAGVSGHPNPEEFPIANPQKVAAILGRYAQLEDVLDTQAEDPEGMSAIKDRMERLLSLRATRDACASVKKTSKAISSLQDEILATMKQQQLQDPTQARAEEIAAREKKYRRTQRSLRVKSFVADRVERFYGRLATASGAVGELAAVSPIIGSGIGAVSGKAGLAFGAAASTTAFPLAVGIGISTLCLGGTAAIMQKWERSNIKRQKTLANTPL